MYRVVILDDDPEQQQQLAYRIQQSPYATLVRCVCMSDPDEYFASAYAYDDLPDILIVNIRFGSEDPERLAGIELVEQLPKEQHTQIVYVAQYDEQHMSVYRTRHAYCMMRPVQQETMDAALALL